MLGTISLVLIGLVSFTPSSLGQVATPDSESFLSFERDIRPVLAIRCLECHSDQAHKGGLRLTRRELATERTSETPCIVPGHSGRSELIRRVTSDDPDLRMPPHGPSLSADEIRNLQVWIDQGAPWPKPEEHWSYLSPKKPSLATVVPLNDETNERESMDCNPIDRLVRQKLRKEKLRFSDEAPPEIILRRLSLDLIGLPPKLEEIQSFVDSWNRSTSEGERMKAIAEFADRYLASPQFGVRWARPWLDLARYADSHGFQRDDLRDIWPYRDWVVRSLNADMPYDQFSIEQIAGDLLPDATEDQRVATGFNRCTTCNVEAGTEPEENRVNQIFDRVNTLGAIWLGTTLECAQCHDHKYDPFTMRDYYQLFAFFNNTALEADRSNAKVPGSIKFLGPYRSLNNPDIEAKRRMIEIRISEMEEQLAEREEQLSLAQAGWEKSQLSKRAETAREVALQPIHFESKQGSAYQILPDHSILLSDDDPPAIDTYVIEGNANLADVRGIKIEALTDPSLPGTGPGRGDQARPNFVLNSVRIFTEPLDRSTPPKQLTIRSAKASFSQKNLDVKELLRTRSDERQKGWAIGPEFRKSHWALLEMEEPQNWKQGTRWRVELGQNFGNARTIGRVKISLVVGNINSESVSDELLSLLTKDPDARTGEERAKVAQFHRMQDTHWNRWKNEIAQSTERLNKLKGPRSLVMEEIESARPSYLFSRGDYRSPREQVFPALPSLFSTSTHDSSSPSTAKSLTRLDLARWLVSTNNPLAARVAVNRWWGEIFGHGLVSTSEDFGLQGDYPTHPELLDWLAVDFQEHDWSMKHFLRTVVTSRVYRQSSHRLQNKAVDDSNKWLSRGPRFRMDAEMIRDNALAIAGLLSLRQGGEPIRPPQPEGLWDKVGGEKYDYIASQGEERFRRGIYVVWKRGSPYPSMVQFDAPSRMTCTVKRSRSNTALQALTLLNDPTYVEIASAFANRIVTEVPQGTTEERIQYAFQCSVARKPQPQELQALLRLWNSRCTIRGEENAWRSVAVTLLNLDETITKP